MSGLARKPPSKRVVDVLLELSRPECGLQGSALLVTRAPPWKKIEMRNCTEP